MNDLNRKWIDFEPEMVPPQNEGRALEARRSVEFLDEDAAKMAFLRARRRLLDVNRWAQYIDGMTAVFQLADQDGELVEGLAREGLMIRIDIPGPGTSAGDGYDWVAIEELEEGSSETLDLLAFRVRPAENPARKEGETAHFFSSGSSGTFVLHREKKEITLAVYDRNLKPNTEKQDKASDTVRNSLVGTTAAMGMSGIQWQKLVDSVLEEI